MTVPHLHPKRSFTGRHTLLPASREAAIYQDILSRRRVSKYFDFLDVWSWLGAVVSVSLKTTLNLDIPSVMLTVLGVVIGFVIAYRVGSGYDRYWMGRTCWSDLIRNSRTMSRLIWFHIPLRLTPKTAEEIGKGKVDRSHEEIHKVMAEKQVALDLILGFCIAAKHHLRSELGIYYEDLYHLVRPLHDHHHSSQPPLPSSAEPTDHRDARSTGAGHQLRTNSLIGSIADPVIPPINVYGTFNSDPIAAPPGLASSASASSLHARRRPSASSHSSRSSQRQTLLPSVSPAEETILSRISSDLIPFSSFFGAIGRSIRNTFIWSQPLEVLPPSVITINNQFDDGSPPNAFLKKRILKNKKHCPRIAGDGQNLPLQISRCLSEWCSVLESRETVPGTTMGSLLGCISAFEDSLSTMERILTTPLPFVYSVHISTVWLYLFFLPFQLVGQFQWHTIPGVFIAAFTYLGFLAAGEEIEQPFGYDDNDLDLDLFCHEIIKADIDRLRTTPCANVYLKSSDGNHLASKINPSQDGNEMNNSVFGMIP